jgi:hypothetical protein
MIDKEKVGKALLGRAGKEFTEAVLTEDERQQDRSLKVVFFALAAILFYLGLLVGAQAMKVVFRTNMGKGAINPFIVYLIPLVFITWSVCVYFIAIESIGEAELPIVPGSFLLTSIFYYVLAVLIFFLGRNELRKIPNNPEGYQGDSKLLFSLKNSGWSKRQIQYIAEPLSVFAISIIFWVINPLLAAPLILCLISMIAGSIVTGISPDVAEATQMTIVKDEDFSYVTE